MGNECPMSVRSPFYLLRMENRGRRGREKPHYGVQPTDRSTERRGIADCDNVAENKLGHDGGQTSRQRMERKPAFGQSRPPIPRRKWQCEKNLLRVAECECSPSVLRPSRITDYAKITMNQLPRAPPPEQSRNSTSRSERDRDRERERQRGERETVTRPFVEVSPSRSLVRRIGAV